MTRLPPGWALPFGRGAQFGGLRELASEYVSRKYVVLAEVSGYTTFPCQGIRRLNDRAKMQAIKTMSKVLKIPEDGYQQLDLMLNVVPPGWSPGMTADAEQLMGVAASHCLDGGYPRTMPAHGQMVGKR